jgi:hypothetical protein
MSESGGVSLIACWFILGMVVVALLMQGGVSTQQGEATTMQSHAGGSSAEARAVDGAGK